MATTTNKKKSPCLKNGMIIRFYACQNTIIQLSYQVTKQLLSLSSLYFKLISAKMEQVTLFVRVHTKSMNM